ncbi:hypothetical protein GE09DRAFT_1234213 [Coniochaeta sp. 2T2.1]|nr:hypothetical protein GE09DRAFT_1234213 [Coniochaeta sp. 2T2.1]
MGSQPPPDALPSGPHPPAFTMDQCYMTPYGLIGVLSDVLSLYIAVCIAMSRTPLYPKRRIRHRKACHCLAVFVLASYWSLWRENVVQCLHYWQLLLISYGNGTTGIALGMFVWTMFFADYQGDTPAARQISGETTPLLDDRGTTACAVTTDAPGEPAGTIQDSATKYTLHVEMSRLLSAVRKQTRNQALNQATEQPVDEPDREATETAADDTEAQTLVEAREKSQARVNLVMWVLLGCCVVCALVGTIALAVEDIRNGSTGVAFISGFFTLVLLGMAALFLLTFRPTITPVDDRYYVRAFLLILSAGATIVYSDLVLGYTLGSVAGVPHPRVAPEELTRYWFYFAALKIHMFAF